MLNEGDHEAASRALTDLRTVHGVDLPGFYVRHGKRAVDLVVSLASLGFAVPLMGVVALFVAIDGAKPVFLHERVGLGGRRFKCIKFRTMRAESAQILAHLLANDPDAAAEWARDRKLSNDPRVTRVGHFLRRTSLDELPQLFNVIRGDMSLVGPRPVTVEELERYRGYLQHYFAVRPGLTGYWQVHGRGLVSYEERVQMDVRYVRSVSLPGDLWLVLQTVLVVLRFRGR